MAGSLRDQLLKQGLATKKQAKKVQHEKREKQKAKRKAEQRGQAVEAEEAARIEAQKALEEKRARDKELNRQREEERKRKEIEAQVADIVDKNAVRYGKGGVRYNFTDGGKIKAIEVTSDQQKDLARGRLAIVEVNGVYSLVPHDAASKIWDRDDGFVVSWMSSDDTPDEDDPYKDYQVPDDLMW